MNQIVHKSSLQPIHSPPLRNEKIDCLQNNINSRVTFLVRKNGKHDPNKMKTDLASASNQDIYETFLDTGVYEHLLAKDDFSVYLGLLNHCDEKTFLKKVTKSNRFINRLGELKNGREFLFYIFEQEKFPLKNFSKDYHFLLINLDIERYLKIAIKDMDFLTRLAHISSSMNNTRIMLEMKGVDIFALINHGDVIEAYLFENNHFLFSAFLNKSNFLDSIKKFFTTSFLEQHEKLIIKKIFNNRGMLSDMSRSEEGKLLLQHLYQMIQNKESIYSNHLGFFQSKKED